jgi:hypothetical protein
MEPASFALGVASIGTLFTTFFDAYDKVRTLKDMGDDLTQHQDLLALESERVRFVKDTYHLESDFPAGGKPLLVQTMKTLNEQISSIQDFLARHFTLVPRENQDDRKKLMGRFSWVASDKCELDRRLSLLHSTVNVLWWLVAASEGEKVRNDFLLRVRVVNEMGDGRGVQAGEFGPQFQDITKAARVKQLLKASLNKPRSPAASSVSSNPSVPSKYLCRVGNILGWSLLLPRRSGLCAPNVNSSS